MRAHVIENGLVVNTILVESLDFMPNLIDASLGGEIGWHYANGTFTPPPPAPPKPPTVPQAVTMRQARLALLAAGKLDAVAPAIAAMPSPAKEQAQIEWEYSIEVQRNRPFVLALGPALGLDDAALDALFIAAEKL